MTNIEFWQARQGFRERVLGWTGQVVRSPVFWGILALKLVASTLFASDYLIQFFVPFLEYFSGHPFGDPYQLFWVRGEHGAFPYPAGMLYIMGGLRAMLAGVGLESLPLHALMLVYRLPLLLADLLIFLVLCRWMRQKVALLIWLYWASPVLFYINYIHGQLDVVPVALLFLSIYFLFSAREIFAAVLLGMALATKTHIVVVVPFVMVYLWQNSSDFYRVARHVFIVALVVLLINVPYLQSDGFLKMVFQNSEQSKVELARLTIPSQGTSFYFIPAVFMVLIAFSMHIRIHNRDVFLAFVGFAFGVILLFVSPMFGWYYWVIPFFAYFFARTAASYTSVFMLLQAAYLMYFAVVPFSDYGVVARWGYTGAIGLIYSMMQSQELDATLIVSLSFTLLQSMLLLCCLVMYLKGIYQPQQHKLTARPFLIGVSGDSGAGKSTLSRGLLSLFGERYLSVICGDDMHKWQRGHDRWSELTHLDPRANELHSELRYLRMLRQNKVIYRRHYDHSTGKFTKEFPIRPMPVMILEGLHSFYLQPAREIIDLKIFVKPSDDLLLHRKVIRDMQKRGYSKETVLKAIDRRSEDSKKYIITQQDHADIVVSFMPRQPIDDIGCPEVAVDEWLRVTLSNAYHLDPLVEDLHEVMPGAIRHYYDQNDLQVIDIDRPIELGDILALSEKHLNGLQEFGVYNPIWSSGWQGVLQLFIGYCIFHNWRDRDHV